MRPDGRVAMDVGLSALSCWRWSHFPESVWKVHAVLFKCSHDRSSTHSSTQCRLDARVFLFLSTRRLVVESHNHPWEFRATMNVRAR